MFSMILEDQFEELEDLQLLSVNGGACTGAYSGGCSGGSSSSGVSTGSSSSSGYATTVGTSYYVPTSSGGCSSSSRPGRCTKIEPPVSGECLSSIGGWICGTPIVDQPIIPEGWICGTPIVNHPISIGKCTSIGFDDFICKYPGTVSDFDGGTILAASIQNFDNIGSKVN